MSGSAAALDAEAPRVPAPSTAAASSAPTSARRSPSSLSAGKDGAGAAAAALLPFLSFLACASRLDFFGRSLPCEEAAGAAVSSARETPAHAAPPATITSARTNRALLKTRTGSRLVGFGFRVGELDLATV